jgi:hypothetical protein
VLGRGGLVFEDDRPDRLSVPRPHRRGGMEATPRSPPSGGAPHSPRPPAGRARQSHARGRPGKAAVAHAEPPAPKFSHGGWHDPLRRG